MCWLRSNTDPVLAFTLCGDARVGSYIAELMKGNVSRDDASERARKSLSVYRCALGAEVIFNQRSVRAGPYFRHYNGHVDDDARNVCYFGDANLPGGGGGGAHFSRHCPCSESGAEQCLQAQRLLVDNIRDLKIQCMRWTVKGKPLDDNPIWTAPEGATARIERGAQPLEMAAPAHRWCGADGRNRGGCLVERDCASGDS